MVTSIDMVLKKNMQEAVDKSHLIAMIADEYIDIAIFKKLMVYIAVVLDGRVQLYFGEDKDVLDDKALSSRSCDCSPQVLASFSCKFG